MPEIIDGFTVFRSWTEMGEGKYYPSIDVEMFKPDGTALRGFRTVHSEGVFASKELASEAAHQVPILGIVTDGDRVIVRVDAL